MPDPLLFFPLASVMVAALGVPLWVGMVPPNRFYGVRVAATLRDEALWYAVNKAAGRDRVAVGGLMLGLSIALLQSDIGTMAYATLMSAALLAGVALILGVGLARTRRLR